MEVYAEERCLLCLHIFGLQVLIDLSDIVIVLSTLSVCRDSLVCFLVRESGRGSRGRVCVDLKKGRKGE